MPDYTITAIAMISCWIVAMVTRKDLAFACAVAYSICLGIAVYGSIQLPAAMIVGGLIDATIFFMAAHHYAMGYRRLSISIMIICIFSLMLNAVTLMSYSVTIDYVGYALQTATVISLMLFDGRRGLCSDVRDDIGSIIHRRPDGTPDNHSGQHGGQK